MLADSRFLHKGIATISTFTASFERWLNFSLMIEPNLLTAEQCPVMYLFIYSVLKQLYDNEIPNLMVRFPTEIWLLITSYLPKSRLFRINTFFLVYCWMNIAWKYVMIEAGSPFDAVRLLLRMVYVP